MRIVFLGTNGWYDTDCGNTICTLIDSQKFYLILDAGNGIYKIDRFITQNKPIYLFLSHLHIDHVEGLHILNKFKFNQGMSIYGWTGIKKELNKLVNEPFTVPFNKLPFKIKIHELNEGAYTNPFPFTALRLVHSGLDFGYRFNIDNKVITYSTDTGICDNDVTLAKGADILIHECSLKEKQIGSKWSHTSPEEAADLAKNSGVGKLILTHFESRLYTTRDDRLKAEKQAREIFGNTFMAFDGLEVVA